MTNRYMFALAVLSSLGLMGSSCEERIEKFTHDLASLRPVNPTVVECTCTGKMVGLDYTTQVSMLVHNDGGEGFVSVHAQVFQEHQMFTQASEPFEMEPDEYRRIALNFSETELFKDAPTCDAEAYAQDRPEASSFP